MGYKKQILVQNDDPDTQKLWIMVGSGLWEVWVKRGSAVVLSRGKR